mgnify:CR=1 FL=1
MVKGLHLFFTFTGAANAVAAFRQTLSNGSYKTMINCPACGNTNPRLVMKEVSLSKGKDVIRGTAFTCIFCPHVFTITTDETDSRANMVHEVRMLLRRGKPRRARRRGLA